MGTNQITILNEDDYIHNLYKPADYMYYDGVRKYSKIQIIRYFRNGRCVRDKGPRSLLFDGNKNLYKAFWGKNLKYTITKLYYPDLSVRRIIVIKGCKEFSYNYDEGKVFDNINFYIKQALQFEAEIKEKLGLK